MTITEEIGLVLSSPKTIYHPKGKGAETLLQELCRLRDRGLLNIVGDEDDQGRYYEITIL
jgi:hypothetical protein